MPIIDGKVVRSRYTSLKIAELSAVDRPAQSGALALIMKRDDGGTAMRSFNKRVDEVAARDGCLRSIAMSKARHEFPDEFEAMQKNYPPPASHRPAPVPEAAAVEKAQRDFINAAREIAGRDRIPLYAAMGKARAEAAAEFAVAYP